MRVGKTETGGLGGVSIGVPRNGFITVANISKSKGSSLTFSALCTRKRHQCIRSLSSCTHRFLNEVDGPRYSFVGKLPPTVTVRRGIVSQGPHSAINADARVCRCLHLLFTHVNGACSPVDKRRIGHRAARSILTYAQRFSGNAGFMVLTPLRVMRNEDLRGRLRVCLRRKCTHVLIGNRFVHVSSFRNSTGPRSVFLIVSHTSMDGRGSSVDHLVSSTRATFCRNSNTYHLLFLPDGVDCSFSAQFRTSNVAFRRPASGVFTFGSPLNTYPAYRKFKDIVNVSRGLIVPGASVDLCSKYIMY